MWSPKSASWRRLLGSGISGAFGFFNIVKVNYDYALPLNKSKASFYVPRFFSDAAIF